MVETLINNLITLQSGFKFDDKRSNFAKKNDKTMICNVVLLLENLNTSHITIPCGLIEPDQQYTLQELRYFVEDSDATDIETRKIYGDIVDKLIDKLGDYV